MTTLALGFGAAVAPTSVRARVPARRARTRALVTRARAQETQDEQVRPTTPRASVLASRLSRVFAARRYLAYRRSSSLRSERARDRAEGKKARLSASRKASPQRARGAFSSTTDVLPPSTVPVLAARSFPP